MTDDFSERTHVDMHIDYLEKVVHDLDGIIEDAQRSLVDIDYDTFVGQGMSGALVIPVLARALNKNWMIVRKPNDGTHSWYKAEGRLGLRWIFVDDLVDTGKTRDRVREVIEEVTRDKDFSSKYIGDFLYHDDPIAQSKGFTAA